MKGADDFRLVQDLLPELLRFTVRIAIYVHMSYVLYKINIAFYSEM